ncbi:MAG TPA: tetratricopeptide repeat protein [Caulifigura sp.]|nr:tetratricopeptide repeat protein [Caulifigura sp.]
MVAAAGAVGTKLLHDFQVRANSAQLLERAETAEKEGKRDDAVTLLNQYISLKFGGRTSLPEEEEKQHLELLVRLGQLTDPGDDPNKPAQLFRAFRIFEEALRRDGSLHDIRRRTAEIAVAFKRHRDAIDHIDVLMKDGKADTAEKVELLKLQGQCQLAMDKVLEAQLSYLDAVATDPKDVEPYVTLAMIWAEYPERAIDASKIESLKDVKYDAIRPALPVESQGPVLCALELLDIMRRTVKPAALAESHRARYLLDLRAPNEVLPQYSKAGEKANTLMGDADRNHDGKLIEAEMRHKSVPVLMDRNSDGQIEREELVRSFEEGTFKVRYETAAAAALSAWEAMRADPELGTPYERADVLMCLIDANLQLADIAKYQSSGAENAKKFRQAAREYVELGQKLPVTDSRFIVTAAELELADVARVSPKPALVLRLEACKQMIRDGLARTSAASEAETGLKSKDAQRRRQLQLGAALKLQWLLVDVLYSLASEQEGPQSTVALEEAKAEIKNLEKQSPNPLLLELLKGRELMVVGDYVGARDHIEKLRSRTEKRSEMWRRTTHLLAECHSRLENTDAVLDLFGVAAQADPALPAVLQWELGHAAAMAQLGKIDEAVQAYLRVLSRAQMPSARTQLIELMLAHLSQQPAQRRNFSVLQSGRERNQLLILPLPEKADEPWQLPEDPHLAVLMQDYAYLRAMTAQQLFELTSAPAQRDAALRYLQLASEILAAARDKFPENLRIPAAQIVLAARQFDQEPAMRVAQTQQALQQAIKDKGDAIELRLAGVQAASLFPPDVAIPMLESATKDVSGLSTDEQSALWHAVARGYAGGGNLDLAIDAWEQAVRLQPRELRPRLAILELLLADAERTNSLEQNVNSPRWQANIEPLNELEGGAAKGPYSCVFAARKHILVALRGQKGEPDAKKLKGDLNFATSLLEAAARMRPYWPTIPRALGTIALINGNADLAAKYFDEAIEKGDRSETVIGTALEHYHTQSQSLDRQERSQAQEKLTKLLELVQTQQSSLLSGNVGRIADQVLWSRSQVAEAIGINEKLRAPTADDKIRLANYELAEVDFGLIRDALTQGDRGALSLKVQERLSKAEALLKEAVAMSPEHAKAWMSLADFYSRIGELPRAEETVLAAGQRLPEKPLHLRPFTMAWCYEALSVATGVTPDKSRQLRDLARQNYQAALEASPDEPGLLFLAASFYSRDREPLQAVRLLDRVLKSGADLPEAARAQAIIAKAATKAQIGQRVALDEGITILRETKFPGKGWHARALRVQRRLLIQRNAKDDARLILESLKSLSDVDELTIEEGLEVARLHDAFGEWANARKQFESLRAKHPQDGAVLATYIHSLIRRPNEPESLKYARSLYEELERSEPTFFRTKATKCRLVAAEGRRDEAVSELLTFVKEHLIDSPKAELLEKIGVEQLETVVENLLAVAKSSQDFATLDLLTRAEQLAKSGSQEEAIAELKKIGNAQKMVAGLRIEALRQAAEVVEELGARDQAIELLREYVARSSRPGAVLDLARCLGRNGQAAEGIELCEKNWERLPISLVAVTEIALLRSIERLDRESEHVAQRLAEGVAAAKEPVAKAELLLLVADIRDFQARYDDAETAFDEVIKLIPGHVVARNNLAFLLANRKKTDRALDLIQGAIASAGPAPELLDTQGVVLMMSGRFEEAVGSLSQAVATQDSSLVRLHLAEAYRLWGKPAQSKAEYEKAVALKLPVGRLHPFDRAIFDRLQTELRVAANR